MDEPKDYKIERQKYQLHKKGYEDITKAISELKEKPEVQKVQLLGAELITIKGEKGDKPSKEELEEIINPLIPTEEDLKKIVKPLIPNPIPGKDGKDYILTEANKTEIAKKIKVPIVEKIIEKTETIIEKPTITEIVKEVAKYEEAGEIALKLQGLKKKWLPIDAIDGDFNTKIKQIVRSSGGANALGLLTDVDLTALTKDANGNYILGSGGGGGGSWGSITGTLSDQTDLQNALDLKANISSLATVATSGDYNDLSNKPTIPTGTIDGTLTANELVYGVDGNTVGSLSVATYPSLTEISYVKGVTSAIQTQLNAKFTLPSLTSGSVLFSNGSTIAQDNSNFVWNNSSKSLRIGGASSSIAGDVDLSITKSGTASFSIQNSDTGAEILMYVSGTTGLITSGSGSLALGAEGDNVLIITNGGLTNIGGNFSPTGFFSVGSTSQFQVSSGGAITSTGINSSGTINFSGLTASQLLATDASKNLVSLDTATYPSLTEISYVKGVTSSIQTQLNSKLSGNQTITLSGDVTGSGATSITTTIANGAVDIAMLSATGTPSGSTYLRGDNTWATISAGGDVSKVGTPVNNQVGVWTGDGTIEGDANLTFDTATDTLTSVNINATTFTGALVGNASTVTTNANLTGVVTSVGNATAIADSALSIAKTSGLQTALDGKQPLDADLTTIAGLTATTDNFIVSVASAWASRTPSQVRTTLGLVIGTNVQAWDAQLDTWATVTPSANGQSLVSAVDYSAMRTLLGLVIGTNVQAYDADLTTWGGKTAPSGTVLGTTDAQTVTSKRIQPRTSSSTTASTLTPDLSSANVYYRTTQTATLTIDAPTGTPVIGETIMIYVDSVGAQTLTINATYKAFGAAFPATTTAGKTFMMSAQWNGTDWKTLWANAV